MYSLAYKTSQANVMVYVILFWSENYFTCSRSLTSSIWKCWI